MKHSVLAVPLLLLGLAAPAAADPLVGFGVSFSFGTGTPDVGLGLRVFSDDEDDSTVASIGMDYMFTTRSWRATAGVAQLMDDYYIGADVGLRLMGGGVDFGMSAGGADIQDDSAGGGGGGPVVEGPTDLE